MSNKRHQISQYVKYWLNARYYKGHGVHSPFVYNFVRNVLYMADKKPAEYRTWVRKSRNFRRNYTNKKSLLNIDNDLGAGTTTTTNTVRLVKKVAIRERYGLLLTRIVNHYKPRNIIELGTSLGISCHYMWLGSDNETTINTIEGSKTLCDIAHKHLQKAGAKNVNVICGDIDATLPKLIEVMNSIDFVFFDANHTKEATLRYYNICKQKATTGTIFIFDDIYWSKDMTEAWKTIKSDPDIATVVDLYQLGIVFFRKGCPKEEYRVIKR